MAFRFRYVTCVVCLSVALGSWVEIYATEPLTLDKPGIVINGSTVVKAGLYVLPVVADAYAVTIEGSNIIVDFGGAALEGAGEGIAPSRFVGTGIRIKGDNITLRNAKVRGYKVGVYAEGSPNLTLENCDVSNNYRQRLLSTPQREDTSDWLWGHENDENQWLRYGAGIYLYKCSGATVRECRARNGQNGLCLVSSDRCYVVDNDMSYMSGWGLAMWRSSRCDVFNNRFDFCVRGYSHGVYERGQDSTGILVYEQCNDNVFAYNSATHGGDGFFLYAGNETVKETGEGGCNGNLLFNNDFSFAVANGIEATFSKGNMFVGNVLKRCRHGLWAGYSYDTMIDSNLIEDCANGISIEHGQNNRMQRNSIRRCDRGIHLWWDRDEDLLASSFCQKRRNCPSRDNEIIENVIEACPLGIVLNNERGTVAGNNVITHSDRPVLVDGDSKDLKIHFAGYTANSAREASQVDEYLVEEAEVPRPKKIEWKKEYPRLAAKRGKRKAFLERNARRGKQFIVIDQWGPYDYSDIRITPKRINGAEQATFRVLGPGGRFEVVGIEGKVKVEPEAGRMPSTVTVTSLESGYQPFAISIRTKQREMKVEGNLLRAQWEVSYYKWREENDPRESEANWEQIISVNPIAQESISTIGFKWGGRAPADGVSSDYFATVARTTLSVPAGKYRLATVSDDGVRVKVDGRKVLENWTWHPPTNDEAELMLEAGEHEIVIEHFEIDGFAQLDFSIERVVDRE